MGKLLIRLTHLPSGGVRWCRDRKDPTGLLWSRERDEAQPIDKVEADRLAWLFRQEHWTMEVTPWPD